MKRSIFLMALTFICSTGVTLAAPGPSATPVINPHPRVHSVNQRLKTQWMKIVDSKKSGKITKQQAEDLRASLKAVRQQEVTFFKQNGNHELTTDQQTQINQILNKNSATLGETPVN